MVDTPHCTIEQADNGFIIVNQSNDMQTDEAATTFESYEKALDYVLSKGWRLKRERQPESLIMDSRFRKL